MKKIIHVAIGLDYGTGGAAHCGRLVAYATHEYCQEKGFDFEVLNLGNNAPLDSNIKICHYHNSQQTLAITTLQKQMFSRNTYLVYDHLGPMQIQGVLPTLWVSPFLIILLGIEAWRPLNILQKRALSSARVINAISAYTARKARESSPWLPPIPTLHLALEPPRVEGNIDPVLQEQLANQAFILMVGRMASNERYKGQDVLIGAMPQIAHFLPSVYLVIVGKGDDLPRLQQLAKDYQVEDKVVFTGFVSDATLDWLYRSCRVYAMPSQHEGFGLVYLEAMRAKKPCLALAGTAPGEIIENGVTGILVEDSEPETIAQALIHLLSNPELCEKMGEAGYQRWLNHFTYAAFKDRFSIQLDRLTAP
jgi:glycosyltransferase involved in cell wall biosynthesis